MKIGKVPTGPIRSTIIQRSRAYSIDRRQGRDTDALGSGVNYEQDATVADLYLYDPSASETVAPVGEQTGGDISGLCLSDADVQVGDRVDYGRQRYEVIEPMRDIPNPQSAVAIELTLERVTNPSV